MAFLGALGPALTAIGGAVKGAAVSAGTALGKAATTVGKGALSAAQSAGVVPEAASTAAPAAMGSPSTAALFSSPMAQSMGMGQGAVFSGGSQVGQGGLSAVAASPEVAASVTPSAAGAGGLDWQGFAKKNVSRLAQGAQQQQQEQQQAAPAMPVQNVPSPAGQLPFDASYFTGSSEEELERLRKLRGGF